MHDKPLIEQLQYLIGKIPPSRDSWTQKAIADYKKDIAQAKKVCGKQSPSKQEIESAINMLKSWWGGH